MDNNSQRSLVQKGPRHARPASFAPQRLTRRGVLVASTVGVLAAAGLGAGLYEGWEDAVDPVYQTATELANPCDRDPNEWGCTVRGTNISGDFYSRYRRTRVGYTVGYPQGHGPGSQLPLIVFLHGFEGTHENCMAGYSPASATSLQPGGRDLTPMALVTVDGGGGYWHPHPGDDPLGMVLYELIPMMQDRGLGRPPHQIGSMGISMGGYGAIMFAEHFPGIFRAAAAISPAIFQSWGHVHYVNPGAYVNAADFAKYDAITHANELGDLPVRVASGSWDPFHPWVEEFVAELPTSDPVVFPPGGHTGQFFHSQIEPSMAFLSQHLTN